MGEMAKSLTQADINAVAAWLAAQPMPSSSKPITALPTPLPLKCGGVPQ